MFSYLHPSRSPFRNTSLYLAIFFFFLYPPLEDSYYVHLVLYFNLHHVPSKNAMHRPCNNSSNTSVRRKLDGTIRWPSSYFLFLLGSGHFAADTILVAVDRRSWVVTYRRDISSGGTADTRVTRLEYVWTVPFDRFPFPFTARRGKRREKRAELKAQRKRSDAFTPLPASGCTCVAAGDSRRSSIINVPGGSSRSVEIDLLSRLSTPVGQVHRNLDRYVHSPVHTCIRDADTCAASVAMALKKRKSRRSRILQALKSTRRPEAKIDLSSSFVGWLTNAIERDGRAESRVSLVNGQKPIRCWNGIECRALSFAFYRLNRWVFLVESTYPRALRQWKTLVSCFWSSISRSLSGEDGIAFHFRCTKGWTEVFSKVKIRLRYTWIYPLYCTRNNLRAYCSCLRMHIRIAFNAQRVTNSHFHVCYPPSNDTRAQS